VNEVPAGSSAWAHQPQGRYATSTDAVAISLPYSRTGVEPPMPSVVDPEEGGRPTRQ